MPVLVRAHGQKMNSALFYSLVLLKDVLVGTANMKDLKQAKAMLIDLIDLIDDELRPRKSLVTLLIPWALL